MRRDGPGTASPPPPAYEEVVEADREGELVLLFVVLVWKSGEGERDRSEVEPVGAAGGAGGVTRKLLVAVAGG